MIKGQSTLKLFYHLKDLISWLAFCDFKQKYPASPLFLFSLLGLSDSSSLSSDLAILLADSTLAGDRDPALQSANH
jgi:hypothetical protein